MPPLLKEKIIVVTGGAGKLGTEFCRAVLSEKGIAIIADSDESRGESIKQVLQSEFSRKRVELYETDINSADSLGKLIASLEHRYGRIDALVNNAYPRNKQYGRHFFDVKYEDFCENMNIHLGGYFLTSQQFAKYFKKQGWGNIINISSIYGMVAPKFEVYEGTPMTVPVEYAAVKSSVIHLTKYMAAYFKGMNIRVNSLSPGGILEGQPDSFLEKYRDNTLNKGMLDPADIQGALLYLLSDMSQYVNGQNLVVDDGFSL